MTAKVSIFTDEKYESLDFISQAVEPFVDPTNDILSNLPDSIEINGDFIVKSLTWGSLYSGDIIRQAIEHLITDDKLITKHLIYDSYRVKSNEESFIVDLVTGKCLFTSSKEPIIKVVKDRNTISDDEVRFAVLEYYMSKLYWTTFDKSTETVRRLKGVCDLFEADKNTASMVKLKSNLIDTINKKIRKDIWRIRSTDAIESLIKLIVKYIKHDQYSAYATLAKFKVLTCRSATIYSLKEIE